nr:uncharacterized protein LOC109152898 [Ipomoea batatas]
MDSCVILSDDDEKYYNSVPNLNTKSENHSMASENSFKPNFSELQFEFDESEDCWVSSTTASNEEVAGSETTVLPNLCRQVKTAVMNGGSSARARQATGQLRGRVRWTAAAFVLGQDQRGVPVGKESEGERFVETQKCYLETDWFRRLALQATLS